MDRECTFAHGFITRSFVMRIMRLQPIKPKFFVDPGKPVDVSDLRVE